MLVDGKVCQTHEWMALLVMQILWGKVGIFFFRDGLDGIVQRNGGDWSMDGGWLFNFNDSIIFSVFLFFCVDNCLSFWLFKG